VSYHVRQLENAGLIELVATEPRRGALEHYYTRA
jgi:predicted transcriptional regulator